MNLIEYINKLSPKLLTILGFILVVLVGLLNYFSGPEIGFSIFYLLPIFLTTWFVGIRMGILISFASAISWLFADLLQERTFSSFLFPYWNAFGRLGFFLVIVLLQNYLKREQLLARTDILTGIGNRKYFFDLSDIEINRARRYNHPFTVAYMDVDDFKIINDSFGHNTGDTVLRLIATNIKNNIRSTDIFARLGGDEFALFLPETEAESAQKLISKLRKMILSAMEEENWPVTFSIGVVTFISLPDSSDEIIKIVDNFMYSAKNRGKDSIIYAIWKQ
jgi:diguanylate cyclase (GGDEF)-like protein